MEVQGTPVNISGRTGATPGPATVTATRVDVPLPPGRAYTATLTNKATTFARQLTIRNFDAAIDLKIRFYDDAYVTIKAGTEKVFTGPIPFFSVQSASATVEWDATAVVAS